MGHSISDKKSKYMILIALGVLSVIFLFLSVQNKSDYHLVKSFMGGRVRWLNGFLAELFDGNLPSFNQIEDHDLTYYLYLTYLGKILRINDAEQLFLTVQMLAYGVVLLIYPALWYYLTQTWMIGYCAPVAVVVILRPMLWGYCNDSYWAMAWTVVMGVPLIAAFYKSYGKSRAQYLYWGGICLVIALGNIPRGHSSMGITLLFFVVLVSVFIKRYKDIKNAGIRILFSALILLFVYQCFTDIVPKAYAHISGESILMENSPVWHTLYVGLGWEENKYNITWNDACGTEAAQKINPNVIHNTKEYHEIIKQVYLSLVKDDPVYVLMSYARKLRACVKVTIKYIIRSPYFIHKEVLVCLTTVILLFNKCVLKTQKLSKSYGVLLSGTIFCGIQSLIFPMIATIGDPYLTGSFAAMDMLIFILVIIDIENIYHIILRQRKRNSEEIKSITDQ